MRKNIESRKRGLWLGLLLVLVFSQGRADTFTWQHPFVFYPHARGVEMYESETVATEEAVSAASANWDFTGKVRLEVSANNGRDYTPVVNGVPLDKGLTAGERLRWRAYLEPGSSLGRVSISTQETFGNPQLSGLKFRKVIEIKGPPDEELFNYQMKFKIGESVLTEGADLQCQGKARADFNDIRFTASDGETSLSFYLENISGTPGRRLATFWVKVPQIPREKLLRLYVYYGNPAAGGNSDAEEVFDFYEDFSGKELDPQKWEIYNELKGKAEIINSELRLENSRILSRDFKLSNGIMEYQASSVGSCGITGIAREKKEPAIYASFGQAAYSSAFPGAEHTIAVGDIVKVNIGAPITTNHPYIYRVSVDGLNLIFERDDAQDGKNQAQLRFSDIAGGLTEGYIGLKGECAKGSSGAVYFDWVRVRQYAKNLPQALASGKEEAVELPDFSGVALSKEGNLVLAKGAVSGRYTARPHPIDFNARVIVPQAGHPLGIRADTGAIYRKGAQPGRYYYVSRGDFVAGRRLQWQAEFSAQDKQKELGRVSLDYYPGVITLLFPNGQEELAAGDYCDILWSAQEYEPGYLLKLEYSLDKGKTYRIITGSAANTGSYRWLVPGQLNSSAALIRISDALEPGVFDLSDRAFSIREKSGGVR
ncbi:MAG: DUF2341 domain-containing protein [Candidatus Omnitrophica bacterium]|nr:DUF2341 domain-containing protein [Candidatus Omnitrophota bacterium]